MRVIETNSSVVSGLGTSKGTVGCDNIYIYMNVEIRMWRSALYKGASLCNGPFGVSEHCYIYCGYLCFGAAVLPGQGAYKYWKGHKLPLRL